MVAEGTTEVNPTSKAALLSLLGEPVRFGDGTGPLLVQLHRYVASLVRCYQGEADELEFPTLCESADTDACGS